MRHSGNIDFIETKSDLMRYSIWKSLVFNRIAQSLIRASIRFKEGLTLEKSALKLSNVANLHYRLSYILNHIIHYHTSLFVPGERT